MAANWEVHERAHLLTIKQERITVSRSKVHLNAQSQSHGSRPITRAAFYDTETSYTNIGKYSPFFSFPQWKHAPKAHHPLALHTRRN